MGRAAVAIALLLAAVLVVAGCGASSNPPPKVQAAHKQFVPGGGRYTLRVAERPTPCQGPLCSMQYLVAYNEPKLTKAQAIQRAYPLARQLARGSSQVVRRLSCQPMPGGWRCEYTGHARFP